MAIHCHTTIDVGELPLDPRIDTAITPDGDLHLTLRYREHSVSVYGKAAEVADLLDKLAARARKAALIADRRRHPGESIADYLDRIGRHGPSRQRTLDEVLR